MKVKTGLMWPPVSGTVTVRKRKATKKTAIGTRSLGSELRESRQAIMEHVRAKTRQAVATDSVRAALHI